MVGLIYSRTLSEDSAAWADDVRRAQEAGLAAVSCSDMAGSDCFVDAAAAAVATERIAVDVSVALPVRSPLQTAYAGGALARLAPGRVRLGLGIGNEYLNRRGHGVPFAPPLARMRDYVQAVRTVLSAEQGAAVEYEGDHLRAAGTGVGAPHLPVVLAAHGPRFTGLALEMADGVILHIFTPLPTVADRMRQLAERQPGFPVGLGRVCAVHGDEEEALRLARAELAACLSLARFRERLAAAHGVDLAHELEEALETAGIREAAGLLPEDVVRSFVTVSTPADLRDHLSRIDGPDTIVPVGVGAFWAMHATELDVDDSMAAACRRSIREVLLG